MSLTLAELDQTPEGWLDELVLQEAGYDLAVAVVQQKQKSKRSPDLSKGGQPVYGMPGRTFVPGQGMQ